MNLVDLIPGVPFCAHPLAFLLPEEQPTGVVTVNQPGGLQGEAFVPVPGASAPIEPFIDHDLIVSALLSI